MKARDARMKRCLDLLVSATAITASSPVLLAIALVIRVSMGAPILFRQARPGLAGRPFILLKFRTMVDARDNQGNLLPAAKRVTRLGHFLRATSLDELPELVNVLRGDMSLVGPRPLLMKYLERYTPEQMRRHDVKPGITGWAQVQGRNSLSWERRFELDIWYIENRSVWLDLRILASTVVSVIRREGINQSSEVTMEEFLGSGGSPSQ